MELDIDGIAHEIWATAQLLPGEGILDGVDRIAEILNREFCKEPHKCHFCGKDLDDGYLRCDDCRYAG